MLQMERWMGRQHENMIRPPQAEFEEGIIKMSIWGSTKILLVVQLKKVLPQAIQKEAFNSMPTECHLVITFANSLDPDQARHSVGPDLGSNCFNTLMVFLKEFFQKS